MIDSLIAKMLRDPILLGIEKYHNKPLKPVYEQEWHNGITMHFQENVNSRLIIINVHRYTFHDDLSGEDVILFRINLYRKNISYSTDCIDPSDNIDVHVSEHTCISDAIKRILTSLDRITNC